MPGVLYIYLDESGDLGFDFKKNHPSKNFVISLLVCRSKTAIQTVNIAAARTLRRKLNYKSKSIKVELKGTETTLKTKTYFYKHIQRNKDWFIYCIVLDKQKLLRKLGVEPQSQNLYNHLARQIKDGPPIARFL